MKVDHLGCLVEKMEPALKAYAALGFVQKTELVKDNYRAIDIIFMEKDGLKIELICPWEEESKFTELKSKKGVGPYHLCYVSDCIENEIKQMCAVGERGGYVQITKMLEAPALGNKRVVFLYHKQLGIIEILEK